jgi:hypothetical protein
MKSRRKPKVDPKYEETEIGDKCSKCKTTVKAKMSGIACKCGRIWFCY